MNTNKVFSSPLYLDWLLVLVLAPVVLVVDTQLDLQIGVQFVLYIISLLFALTYSFLEATNNHSKWWLELSLPLVLFFLIFWDVVYPLQQKEPSYFSEVQDPNIPFALLKILLYLLILVQLPQFLFGKERPFKNLKHLWPVVIALVLVIFAFGRKVYGQEISKPIWGGGLTFLARLSTREVLATVFAIAMLGMSVFLVQRSKYVETHRQPFLIGIALLVITTIAGHFYFNLFSGVPISYLCLFLYILSLPVYREDINKSVRAFVILVFAVAFLLIYYTTNAQDVHRSIEEALKFRQSIAPWGDAVVIGLGIVASILEIVAFLQRWISNQAKLLQETQRGQSQGTRKI